MGFFCASRRNSKAGIALAALALAAFSPSGRAEQVLVASLVDDITYSDIVSGGDCHTGCQREEHAVAHVSGTPQTPSCELQTISPFDRSTPEPGLLRASIYCEDSTGALIEQGVRPCIFSVCVDFKWTAGVNDEDGQLTYDVVIERPSKPSASHTVYVDLSVAVDPTANSTSVDSCLALGECVGLVCEAPAAYTAEVTMTDEFGDGWVGGIAGTYNLWELWAIDGTTGEGEIVTRGTLADNHESGTTRECLPDGKYVFNTTANAAFAEDMKWGICENYGDAGEGLEFVVANGACNSGSAVKIERATAEETDDAAESYCILPAAGEDDYRTETCTALSSGMKIDGVGLYYDDRCNSADLSGCGARSIAGCRLCFVDKQQWLTRFPTERVPDWELCPCCVADTIGVDCATGGGSSGMDEGVVIGVSVGIAGVIAIACCLSCAFGTTIVRFFRRMRKKKHAEDRLEFDTHAGISAFPDSPSNGGTMRGGGTGLTTQGNRDRGRSGHFPIPRFDSIRGRFDSGIFASNSHPAGASNNGTGMVQAAVNVGSGSAAAAGEGGGSGDLDKVTADGANVSTTAQSTPSGLHGSGSVGGGGGGGGGGSNAPRSTVLDERLVAQGYTTSDVGRPLSGTSAAAAGRGGQQQTGSTGWGLAMSGEYPDLEGTDPYAIDNAMAETGTTR